MGKTSEKSERVIEVCAGSYEDCLRAERGGADRAELNSALSAGGLTPTTATLKMVKRDTDLNIICMARPRAAGFCYREAERRVMFVEARELLEAGADGIAFGFLRENGRLDEQRTEEMVRLIHSFGGEAVFHRAFDVCKEPREALESLISLGVDRVLTSGCQATAWEGRELLRELQGTFGSRIELLAGSGVNAANAKELMEYTGIRQVHSSCKTCESDPTTRANGVSYAYLPKPHEDFYEAVSEERVRELARAARG